MAIINNLEFIIMIAKIKQLKEKHTELKARIDKEVRSYIKKKLKLINQKYPNISIVYYYSKEDDTHYICASPFNRVLYGRASKDFEKLDIDLLSINEGIGFLDLDKGGYNKETDKPVLYEHYFNRRIAKMVR